jgi:hypothetical protein
MLPEFDNTNVFDGEFSYEYKGLKAGGWRNDDKTWSMAVIHGGCPFFIGFKDQDAAREWARSCIDEILTQA